MRRFMIMTLAAATALSTAAVAAPRIERVRGTIVRAEESQLTIRLDDGGTRTVSLGADTKYAAVVKSSLDDVRDGTFIGTATKDGDPRVAIEVVLFPEAMRGTGEGHYAWDEIEDPAGGGTRVRSAMTNGTVASHAGGAPRVRSTMTNGTVAGSAAADGRRTLTVTYGKDGSQTVVVPPSVPVVTFEPADPSIMKPGARAFVTAANEDGTLSARRVAVGRDGLRPPM